MIVRLQPAAGVQFTVVSRNGTRLTNAEIESIELTPFFSSAQGVSDVLLGVAQAADGTAVDRFALTVSGISGKLGRRDRAEQSVVPLVDRPRAAAAVTAAAAAVLEAVTENTAPAQSTRRRSGGGA